MINIQRNRPAATPPHRRGMTMDEMIVWLEDQGAAPDPERILFELCRSLYAGDIASEKDLQDAAEYILEFWQDQTPGELGW